MPSQKGKLGEEEERGGSTVASLSKLGLHLLSSRMEGSGCSQQGAKSVSCLIFFMAKQMPVSVVLTQVPERGEKFTLNINFPPPRSPVRIEYSPGGSCLLKFPCFPVV